MNKETLFSSLPLTVVKEEDAINRIQEEKELVHAGVRFASQLSINRYTDKPLTDYTVEEKLNLFSTLHRHGFVYGENALYFSDLDTASLTTLLQEKFNLTDFYQLDNYYVEQLLQGKDIAREVFTIAEEDIELGDLLGQFVFTQPFGMDIGDTPNLMLMLVVKKALLGAYLAEQNVALLEAGKREVYDIEILK